MQLNEKINKDCLVIWVQNSDEVVVKNIPPRENFLLCTRYIPVIAKKNHKLALHFRKWHYLY